MDGKGSDALLKTSRSTEWTINNGGYTSLLFTGFLLLGCILAYVIAVARGNVDAFLPLISDAAGSPPQNGLFGTLISIGGMFGVVFMVVRYMMVLENNREKSKMILFLNQLSLVLGIISLCGITLITGYPINFYRNRDVWESDVGIPHMVGGVMFFSLGIIYAAIQCILTLFLKPRTNQMFFTRIIICGICTVTFVYHLVMVPDNFQRITDDMWNRTGHGMVEPSTMGASLKLPIDTGGSYLTSAITEWLLVFFYCAFFVTFFNEMQEYSLLLVVETQFPEYDVPENKKLNEKDGSVLSSAPLNERRTSEVQTIFRRDSTCQTMDDGQEVIFTPSSKVSSFQNGRYIQRQVSSFEVLSGDKLEKLIEKTMKSKSKGAVDSIGNGVKNGPDSNGSAKQKAVADVDPVTDGIREYIESVMERQEDSITDNGRSNTERGTGVQTVDVGC